MSAELNPKNIHTLRTDWLANALDKAVAAGKTLQERRSELGADSQSRIKQALAAATQKQRRKLSPEEKLELAGMEATHKDSLTELGKSLASVPDESVTAMGLRDQVREIRETNEALTDIRRIHGGIAHRWVPFTSLPARRQGWLTMAAVGIIVAILGGLAIAFPAPLSNASRLVAGNDSLNRRLHWMSPQGFEKPVPGLKTVEIVVTLPVPRVQPGEEIQLKAVVTAVRLPESEITLSWQNDGNGELIPDAQGAKAIYTAPLDIEDDESDKITLTATYPGEHANEPTKETEYELVVYQTPRIELWPLARPDFQLAWRIDGSLRSLGFIEDQIDSTRVLYFPANAFATGRTETLDSTQYERIDPSSAETSSDRYGFVGRALHKLIRSLSIESGKCLSDPDTVGREAKVTLRSSESVKAGTQLHVVRRTETAEKDGSRAVRFEDKGVVTVVLASSQDSTVHVPTQMDLSKGDWVFPHVSPDIEKRLLVKRINSSHMESTGDKNIRERRLFECQETDDLLESALRDLGVELLNELSSETPDFELQVKVDPGKSPYELKLTATLSRPSEGYREGQRNRFGQGRHKARDC